MTTQVSSKITLKPPTGTGRQSNKGRALKFNKTSVLRLARAKNSNSN